MLPQTFEALGEMNKTDRFPICCGQTNFKCLVLSLLEGFPGGTSSKEPTCQSKRLKRYRFDPWIGKIPGGGHGNPLQYSCLENPMDRGAWWATVHRVANSQT